MSMISLNRAQEIAREWRIPSHSYPSILPRGVGLSKLASNFAMTKYDWQSVCNSVLDSMMRLESIQLREDVAEDLTKLKELYEFATSQLTDKSVDDNLSDRLALAVKRIQALEYRVTRVTNNLSDWVMRLEQSIENRDSQHEDEFSKIKYCLNRVESNERYINDPPAKFVVQQLTAALQYLTDIVKSEQGNS